MFPSKLGKMILFTAGFAAGLFAFTPAAHPAPAVEYVVYSVYRELDLGNPGETPQRDYYVNMGAANGVQLGSILTVIRRTPTYDILSEKIYKDIAFPIGRLKVIHVEANAAVARVEKMYPSDKFPAASPRAVMVGDLVRLAE